VRLLEEVLAELTRASAQRERVQRELARLLKRA
jgi:hypothetical protein